MSARKYQISRSSCTYRTTIDIDHGTDVATRELEVWVLRNISHIDNCHRWADVLQRNMDAHIYYQRLGQYHVLRERRPRSKYSVIPNIEIVLCPSSMMILERGTVYSYAGISSRVRLLPVDSKHSFLFIFDAKTCIISSITMAKIHASSDTDSEVLQLECGSRMQSVNTSYPPVEGVTILDSPSSRRLLSSSPPRLSRGYEPKLPASSYP